MLGSIVGGVVANAIGTGDVFELNFIGTVVAVSASVVLIIVGERIGAINNRARRRDQR